MKWEHARGLSCVILRCSVRARVGREGRCELVVGGGGEGVGMSWVVLSCIIVARIMGGEASCRAASGC